jgi:hypothetical protein
MAFVLELLFNPHLETTRAVPHNGEQISEIIVWRLVTTKQIYKDEKLWHVSIHLVAELSKS